MFNFKTPTSLEDPGIKKLNILKMLDPEDKAKSGKNTNLSYESLLKSFQAFYQYDPKLLSKNRNSFQKTVQTESKTFCNSITTLLRPNEITSNLSFNIRCSLLNKLFPSTGIGCPLLQKNKVLFNSIHRNILAEIFKDPNHSPIGSIPVKNSEDISPQKAGMLLGNLIAKGIEDKQKFIWKEIIDKQKLPIEHYSMEAAFKDIMAYQSACTVTSGLDFSQRSIKAQEFNPYFKVLD